MISEKIIEKWNTIYDAENLINEFFETIKNNDSLKKKARLKDKGYPFKQIFEEYIPLIQFAKFYYNDVYIEIRYTGEETQNDKDTHDGEIKLKNGDIITVEIARPIFGKKEHDHALQLNKNGFTEVEISNFDTDSELIIDIIKNTAIKKSTKNYENTVLVFYPPDINKYLFLSSVLNNTLVESIINTIKSIKYNAKEVFLLIPELHSSEDSYNGELIKIF